MEPPIRYSISAPSKRFYSVLVICQLALLSMVVAVILITVNYRNLKSSNGRVGYVLWLVISACATSLLAFTAFIFWHKRRRMRYMQDKLKSMQMSAEAQGSQKRLEAASVAPQLRTETDHRQSILLAQHTPVGGAELFNDHISRNSALPDNGGRRRQYSSAAGEGCELSLFQTHLSSHDSTETIANTLIRTPPRIAHRAPRLQVEQWSGNENAQGTSTAGPGWLLSLPLATHDTQRQRESTTTRLFQDDPTMIDLFHGLRGDNTSSPAENVLSFTSPLSSRHLFTADDASTTPLSTACTLAARRRQSLRTAPANRSSAALPNIFNDHDATDTASCSSSSSSSSTSIPFPFRPRQARSPPPSISFSPDYDTVLPSFPLPPTHARFSDAPSSPLARTSPPPSSPLWQWTPSTRARRRSRTARLGPIVITQQQEKTDTTDTAEDNTDPPTATPEERAVWSRMNAPVGGSPSPSSSSQENSDADDDKRRRGASSSSPSSVCTVVHHHPALKQGESVKALDGAMGRMRGRAGRGGSVFVEILKERTAMPTATPTPVLMMGLEARRDSHVDVDAGEEDEVSPGGKTLTDVSTLRLVPSNSSETKGSMGHVKAAESPERRPSSRGLAPLDSLTEEKYARLDGERWA
ncbi:hypothetical protein MPH_02819 [Macrophomina phaseolina MS6]|uniref:Uncharacterized protein n=1 Tax=Macrophomina phaseolina (strain MS6) TaxID=1126212 RepID=K2S4D7_MACPH|nr:hypothetical protein MPH_02819 [Macrophomina phaseolina MS6]